jgi:HEAT repeat protein
MIMRLLSMPETLSETTSAARRPANLRKEAAAALGEIASAAGEPFLALVANDPDPDVRKNACWALQQIAPRKAKAGS